MEKETKKKLKEILHSLTVEAKVIRPTLVIEKNMDKTMKKSLSNEAIFMLTSEINNIVQKQKLTMKNQQRAIEEIDFQRMKRNLKIYAKNKSLFKMNKIIRMTRQPPPPLKNIVKIHENKFNIAKQYSIRLGQKIDAIMQSENITKIKNSKIQHLQNKIQAPLVKKLRRLRSTHNFGRTERVEPEGSLQKVDRLLWTQRISYFGQKNMSEHKELDEIAERKFQKYRSGYNLLEMNQNGGQMRSFKYQKQNYKNEIFQTNRNVKLNKKTKLRKKAMEGL